MKFIKNRVILEPKNEFVIEQMKKGGYQVYDEGTKEEKCEETAAKEIKKDTKKKKK